MTEKVPGTWPWAPWSALPRVRRLMAEPETQAFQKKGQLLGPRCVGSMEPGVGTTLGVPLVGCTVWWGVAKRDVVRRGPRGRQLSGRGMEQGWLEEAWGLCFVP